MKAFMRIRWDENEIERLDAAREILLEIIHRLEKKKAQKTDLYSAAFGAAIRLGDISLKAKEGEIYGTSKDC